MAASVQRPPPRPPAAAAPLPPPPPSPSGQAPPSRCMRTPRPKVARLAIARQFQVATAMAARCVPRGPPGPGNPRPPALSRATVKWAGPAQRRLRPGSNGGPLLSSGPAPAASEHLQLEGLGATRSHAATVTGHEDSEVLSSCLGRGTVIWICKY
jgi:hypothetical protein